MKSLVKPALLALSAWTVFIWSTRVRNILDDVDLSGWSLTWRLGISVAFIAAALAIVVLTFLAKSGTLRQPAPVAKLGAALAIAGGAWWLVRGAQILLADHGGAFKVVHSVLGLVTIGLSVWVLSATSSPADRSAR